MTFARWGSDRRRYQRWDQLSRPGRQLVLQLKFPHAHNVRYHRLIPDAKKMPFAQDYHPVNMSERITMAWACIDIDLPSGEALIEEVQSDWIRNVGEELAGHGRGYVDLTEPKARENLQIYAETVLAAHTAMWSEAVLAAALHVLTRLCGIARVWFHHFDTGCEIKGMRGGWRPPRSLYSDLPKRFCFALTDEPPEFILAAQPCRLRQKWERREERFWRLER